MTAIYRKGTVVELTTVTGPTVTKVLAADYQLGYGCWFENDGDPHHATYLAGADIVNVEALAPV